MFTPRKADFAGDSVTRRRVLVRPHPGRRHRARIERLEGRTLLSTLGPVLALGFEEPSGSGVNDASGFSNNGQITGATRTVSGRYGSALSFDGSGDYVTVNDTPSLDLSTGMTLSAWVYPTSNSGKRDVIIKEGVGVDVYNLYSRSGNIGPEINAYINGANHATLGSALPLNSWSYLAGTFDGAMLRLYVNGSLTSSLSVSGLITTSSGALRIGGNTLWGEFFLGRIDEVRAYDRALSASEIATDMQTPVPSSPPTDTTPPVVADRSPVDTATTTGTGVNVVAQFNEPMNPATVTSATFELRDPTGNLIPATVSYNSATWQATLDPVAALPSVPNYFTARVKSGSSGAKDVAGNALVTDVTWSFAPSTLSIVNETVVGSGLTFPTSMEWLPDGRMLITELQGKIWLVQPGQSQPDPTPLLQITNINTDGLETGGERGLQIVVADPSFASNGYIYVFYTANSPLRDRVSRFTVSGNSVNTQSEVVLWQDNAASFYDHHGGTIAFGPDGMMYVTVGDHGGPADSQSLRSFHGKVLRLNLNGTVPTDNPFYDGNGPNYDAIWALGLRNPFRASFDSVTGKLIIGDVGGNDVNSSIEEINIGQAGGNYGWPNLEGITGTPGFVDPIFQYPHDGRDAAVTGGFIYRGAGGPGAFPAQLEGSYFYGDYAQNFIRRLTLDGATGAVVGSFNFEPFDGSTDGPMGDPVQLRRGADGALYYVDFGGYPGNDASIRRLRYVASNVPPTVAASASPTDGAPPLLVNFSSAGTIDPDTVNLLYDWDFGDGADSSLPNPTHTYASAGTYTARLHVFDGTTTVSSSPITIRVGNAPVVTIDAPIADSFFRAGNVINFSAEATDIEDGDLPGSAFTWTVLFHHEGHVHPTLGPVTGSTSGSFTIPSAGHAFAGNTSYEIILVVRDSTGLESSESVFVYPEKVNLEIRSSPPGIPITIDGLPRVTPHTIDTLIGFQQTVAAPATYVLGGVTYYYAGWSDGGPGTHVITTPDVPATYTARYSTVRRPGTPAQEYPGGTSSRVTQPGTTLAVSGYGGWSSPLLNWTVTPARTDLWSDGLIGEQASAI